MVSLSSAVRQKYLSSFVDTMKQGEQRELGKLGERLAVQLFLPSFTSLPYTLMQQALIRLDLYDTQQNSSTIVDCVLIQSCLCRN
jgi:hypothetical protein